MYSQMINNTVWLSAAGDLTSRVDEEKQVYAAYPNYNEMMMGISETSGLGDKTYLTCSIIQLFHILTFNSTQSQCSFDAVWGRLYIKLTGNSGAKF